MRWRGRFICFMVAVLNTGRLVVDGWKETFCACVGLDPRMGINAFVTDEGLEIVFRGKARREGSVSVVFIVGSFRVASISSDGFGSLLWLLLCPLFSSQPNNTLWVPPVLATPAILLLRQAKALKHGSLLLMGVIYLPAATESVLAILVVGIAFTRLLPSHGIL